MKATGFYFFILVMLVTVTACNTSRKQVLASGSQVELRSYQTRTYDTDDKVRVLRAIMATLQDLGFVIEKADDVIGVVTATKLRGYALSMSVSVRPNGQQMTVRANAQYNLTAVEEPGPYQSFFTSLDKGLFLDDNLYAGSVATQTPSENSSTGVTPKKPDDVFAYYGEAEQEITDGTYNKNLWARALVEVQGDEQKRKAKYIELRAMELYAAEAMSLSTSTKKIRPVVSSQTAVSQQPKTVAQTIQNVDISGTYVSEITSNSDWFKEGNDRVLQVNFVQTGNRITGTTSSTKLKIIGTRDGDDINFYVPIPNKFSQWHQVSGTWKVSADGTRLEGNWSVKEKGHYGKWNLVKVGTSQTAVNRQPVAPVTPDIPVDFSGTYRSDITGSGDWSLGKLPNIEVILKQNKDEISGTFSGTRVGEIEGILNGGRIKFKWFVTAGRTESGRGEWKLTNDGINWNGTWRSSRGTQGNWNLTKIE
jgi:hypothetical protein